VFGNRPWATEPWLGREHGHCGQYSLEDQARRGGIVLGNEADFGVEVA
jgi:hypothetical protein